MTAPEGPEAAAPPPSAGPFAALVRREWGQLGADARRALAPGVLRALPLSLLFTVLSAALHLWAYSGPDGAARVAAVSGVTAGQPWWQSLARTPLSLFAPAPDLPLWGALAQILVLFGVAELTLGRARTLCFAYAGTLAGTSFARLGTALGPGFPVLGLPAGALHESDTGPSAAVVALVTCVAWHYRARVTRALIVVAMLVELTLLPNLAAREHLTAVSLVFAVCAAERALSRGAPAAGRRVRRCVRRGPRTGRG